jgi:uncharacterized Zn-finger protein
MNQTPPDNITYLEQGHTAKCAGDASDGGHPLIYLDLSEREEVVCPYCSHIFRRRL